MKWDIQPRIALVGILFTSAFLVPYGATDVHAAEWYLEPELSLSGIYDDNRFLDPTDEEAVLSGTVSPAAIFGRRTPTLDLRGGGRLDAIFTDSERDPDRLEGLARLRSDYRTETTGWLLDATYRRDTTIRTDIRDPTFDAVAPPDTGDLQDPDLGLTDVELPRNQLGIGLSADWEVSKRTALELAYRFTYIFYEDEEQKELAGLENNRTHVVTPSFAYRLSQVDTLRLLGSYQRFDDEGDTGFDNVTGGVEIAHIFSQTLQGRLFAGATYTKSDDDQDDTSFAANAQIEKQFRKSVLRGFFRYGVQPSSRGNALQRAQLDVRWLGDITPRWAYIIAARAFRNENLGDAGTANKRYYVQFDPSLSWQFSRAASFRIGYRLRWEDQENADDTSLSNAGLISFIYEWDRLSVSR
jgi:hypothetical protein